MLPYGRHAIDESDVQAVTEALRSDWLTTGPRVDEFESELAATAGAEYAVAVTSGTAALHVAYAASGIGAGTEVVTTPLTFIATAATAVLNGANVVFADIDYETGLLDIEAAADSMTSRTRAIAAVDYAGLPIDAKAFANLAHGNDAILIEDAAHSIGSMFGGAPVGSVADLTTFSFFPTKNMTSAEGGAVVTSNGDLALAARRFKGQGLIRNREMLRYPHEGPWHQEVHEFGLNYRLPDVLCALGLSQLRKLEAFKKRRQEIHDLYNQAFANEPDLKLPIARKGDSPAWHLYPLRVPANRRSEMFTQLRQNGIGVQVNYMPAYWHPVFEDLGYKRGSCPQAERYYSEEISLPLFPTLTDDQVEDVAATVIRVLHR